ncbi:AIPR family protein [Mucilaginibacter sp.]|uniref:AIPR family protein n=1 Tax=Mucilaginibacter sp. TaxID=1882438 RepID=UPI002632AC4A|nr:AIPR family protein [Mucilaginibacter sp.]MDB4919488.1 hypothetical protein [Mucilaginibacter sp.]
MEHKYKMLISVLDKLCGEAPSSYKSYKPNKENIEEVQHARSLGFIHLLLKVKFGIADFLLRHKQITDGPYDGGLDAFHIDFELKKLYLIQTKFRNNSKNFDNKSINAEELMRMEIARITKGEQTDSNGNLFNEKVIAFQKELIKIRDIAKYDYIVLLLGNVYKYNDEQIRRLIDNTHYEIYDAEKAYDKLIFPLTTGTYYDPDEIVITIDLVNKERPRLKQTIETDYGNFEVNAIFVPTYEIGRILSHYKNAILKFNPRNFLSLQKKSVNENIRHSITNQEKNNFAILNNGITILSVNFYLTESSGKQNEGQLILTKPQILNGGQTAYTLSTIYDEFLNKPNNPLIGKEVLLKIITPIKQSSDFDPRFIELISNATNQQNEVSEADRRSNHDIQIFIQKRLYNEYGYLYERKSGEFHDGIFNGFIDIKYVIDRLKFIKAYWAYKGEPAAARRTSEKIIFKEETFFSILHDENNYHEMLFAFLLFSELEQIENTFKRKSDSVNKYGYSLLYGKWAVVASIGLLKPIIKRQSNEIFDQVKEFVEKRLTKWKEFDEFIKDKHAETNYFNVDARNYELYYKVNLLDEDIKEFFLK